MSGGMATDTTESVSLLSVTVLPETTTNEQTSTSVVLLSPVTASPSVAIADQLLDSTGTSFDAGQSSSSALPLVGDDLPVLNQSTSLVIADQPLSTVTFASLMPVPHLERSRGKPRKKPPSYEVTNDECMSFVADRMTKTSAKSKPKVGSGVRVTGQVRKVATVISSTGESSAHCGKVKKTHKEKASVKSKTAHSTDYTACLYCEIMYYESSVPWIQCKVCGKWACGQCAHLGKKNKKTNFKCDGCK